MTRVGFFDSGIGGTSILNAFKSLCPEVDTVYIADTENCPYGNKPKEKIIELSRRNVAVRAGLHCAPLAHESAGTLPNGTLRLSFSAFNTVQEGRRLTEICKKVFNKV